jgi:DNA helicase-2/ATP-dependent DNA helicase PcrA
VTLPLEQPKPEGGEFRVYGPPGCGKTTWITRQLKLASDKYGPQALMVASLTRAAAAEVAGRDHPLTDDQVGTLHAFAYRALGRVQLTAEPDVIEEWNRTHSRPDRQLSGGKRGADDEDLGQSGGKTPGDQLHEDYHRLRSRLVPRELWPTSVNAFAQAFETFKRDNDLHDFTDLLEVALREIPEAPGRPQVGFFDEAQDLAPLELALVRQWGSRMDYFTLVGDDDQAIYYFRGATADAFLNPPLHEGRERVLSQSYRVPRKVQAAAMAWISAVKGRKVKEYKPRDEEGAVRQLPRATWRQPAALLKDVEHQLAAGRSVMVLATAGYQLGPTRAALREAGIPFWNPYRKAEGAWNPLHPSRGLPTSQRVLAFLRPDDALGADMRMWTGDDWHAWTELVTAKGFLHSGAKKAIESLHESPWGRQEVSLEKALQWVADQDLQTLIETFEPTARVLNPHASIDWLEQRLLASKREAAKYALQIARRSGPTALQADPRVILGTVHSVKGGQSDVVYVFPDLSAAAQTEWIVPGDGHDAITRTFYVALTRAKHSVALCGAAGASINWAPALAPLKAAA